MARNLLLHQNLLHFHKYHGMRIEIISEKYHDYLLKILNDSEIEFTCREKVNYIIVHEDYVTFICNETGEMFTDDFQLWEFLEEIRDIPVIIYRHEDL